MLPTPASSCNSSFSASPLLMRRSHHSSTKPARRGRLVDREARFGQSLGNFKIARIVARTHLKAECGPGLRVGQDEQRAALVVRDRARE